MEIESWGGDEAHYEEAEKCQRSTKKSSTGETVPVRGRQIKNQKRLWTDAFICCNSRLSQRPSRRRQWFRLRFWAIEYNKDAWVLMTNFLEQTINTHYIEEKNNIKYGGVVWWPMRKSTLYGKQQYKNKEILYDQQWQIFHTFSGRSHEKTTMNNTTMCKGQPLNTGSWDANNNWSDVKHICECLKKD